MSLFRLGDFVLNSGKRSDWKLECDDFTQQDWRALAKLITKVVPPFGTVEGIPRGGIYLAECLDYYRECRCGVWKGGHGPNRPVATCGGCENFRPILTHLLVDDVLTTGGSMERARAEKWYEGHPNRQWAVPESTPLIRGAVVFARGPTPGWITPLFQMPNALWLS